MGATVNSTQGWTQYTFTFNSLNYPQIRIYFGLWGSITGSLWFDDVSDISELGLYHTVRRSLMPVIVKSWDGNTTFLEGRDYTVADQELLIPSNSTIANGAALKVSWMDSI